MNYDLHEFKPNSVIIAIGLSEVLIYVYRKK